MSIRDFIPVGSDNAISRTDLSIVVGTCDRSIREHIEYANNSTDEPPILNLGHGYFIPSENEDHLIEQYITIENARQSAINRKIRKMKTYLQNKVVN